MDTVGTRSQTPVTALAWPRLDAAAAWTRFSSCRLAAAVSPKPSSPPGEEHPGREEDGKASEDEEEALGGEKDGDCSRQ